jgi:hypothetical protein
MKKIILSLVDNLIVGIRCIFSAVIFFGFATLIYAAEDFTPGIYVNDSNGDQYIVSGSNTGDGRTIWTVLSGHNSSRYFSGIWETGAAVGNPILAGSQSIVSYPNGYKPGRSYGVIGSNNIHWSPGGVLAVSHSGDTISISTLTSDGSTRDQFTLALQMATGVIATSSEQFVAGVFRDIHGYGYLLSGAPSQPGRSVWIMASLPDNPNQFKASWETGAAVGNALLAGNSYILTNPNGYLPGRSYGIIGSNNINWAMGRVLAASQTGKTISISNLNSDGSTYDLLVLTQDNSISISNVTGSENFSPGFYRASDGKRYVLSGSAEARGRTLWTLASVSMPTIFNASWETGTAVGNALLADSPNIVRHSNGYLPGRSYGVIGSNNIDWNKGRVLAASQAGKTIAVSNLNSDGSTYDLLVLTQEQDTKGSIGTNTESYVMGADYEDVKGNTYTVMDSGNMWSILGTGDIDFNAQWQTGLATTNTLLTRNSNISRHSDGYLPGRSYGVIGSNNINWNKGRVLAASQTGKTISIWNLNSDGSIYDEFQITKGGTGGIGNSGTIAFAAATYYVNKFDGKAKIGITRTDGGAGMVSIMCSTSDGSAHSGSDYTAVSGGMLAWNNGDTATKFININIPTTANGGTTFTITLSNPVGGAVIGPQVTASIKIIDTIISANLSHDVLTFSKSDSAKKQDLTTNTGTTDRSGNSGTTSLSSTHSNSTKEWDILGVQIGSALQEAMSVLKSNIPDLVVKMWPMPL